VIANDLCIAPPSVLMGQETYPADLPGKIALRFPDFILVDGQQLAIEAGNARAANTVLLGAVSKRMQIEEKYWLEAIERMVPKKALAVNLKAFEVGRSLA
jgi:indolepyruvate ferredoxin oxidoreductase beta subunit